MTSETGYTHLVEYKRARSQSSNHHIAAALLARYIMSLTSVQYMACADWMWINEKWMVRQIAFAPVWAPDDTLVVTVKKDSWGLFTFAEVQKNVNLHPLQGFVDKSPKGRQFQVELDKVESFLRGQFYHTVLKEPDSWDVTIGTKDLATFMYLEPILRDKMVFLGEKVDIESTVSEWIKG